MPTSDEIFGKPLIAPPWLDTQSLLDTGIVLLPMIASGFTADLVERLMLGFVSLREELQAVRATHSALLHVAHALHTENVRLRRRVIELLEARRPSPSGQTSPPAGAMASARPRAGAGAGAIQALNRNTNNNTSGNTKGSGTDKASTRLVPVQGPGQGQ